MTIQSEIQKLQPSNVVVLFKLDYSGITGNSGDVLRWHNGVNELGVDVVWDGNTYTRLPIDASGFSASSTGSSPRPALVVANVTGAIGNLARGLEDLVGAKLHRRRTFLKYLDAVNYPGGVNPDADPNALLREDVWIVDSRKSEDEIAVTFELVSPVDLPGLMLPKRKAIQNNCSWQYRSTECSYSGGPVANSLDVPVASLDDDVCGKRLTSCRLRFPQPAALPFGGFPGLGLLR